MPKLTPNIKAQDVKGLQEFIEEIVQNELEVLMVNSIYKLDLSRPKNSFLYKYKENREFKKAEEFLVKKSLMGKYLPSIAVLAIDLFASIKGVELSEEQEMEYLNRYSRG